jgi:hypothetical protein
MIMMPYGRCWSSPQLTGTQTSGTPHARTSRTTWPTPAHGAEPAGRPEIQADAPLAGPPDTGLPRVPADGTPPWTSAPPRSPGQLGHAPLAASCQEAKKLNSGKRLAP